MSGSERPPWASGKIVSDYRPLYAYWRLARQRGREDLIEASTLRREDFESLRSIVEGGTGSALELVERLASALEERVDPDVAAEAILEALGVRLEPEEARRRIARILAGWLVEAGEYWRILKLRLPWEPPTRGDGD